MSVPLANYTLTYAESSKGWPSFYSFEPEYIKGMNQYLYTFKGGNMYRHNVNETRNEFYGSPYSSKITTVLNTDALTSKVFKTIQLEAQDPWKVTVNSDIQNARDIEYQWFKKKEGDWFAFVRGLDRLDGQYNFNMRSAKGVGVPTTIAGANPQTITFSIGITTPIQVGDSVFSTADTETIAPTLVGVISSIPAANQIIVDTTTSVQNPTNPAVSGDFVFYVRNQIAESQGLLGHYCVMTLENDLTTATEMMAVKVDIMKSYP
jgi:hypothetical protein